MIAVIAVTPVALPVARVVAQSLPDAQLHGLAGRIDQADVLFSDAKSHIRQLFLDGHTVIGVCAAGILIRAVAPALVDKQAEPPVLAVAPDGSSVVPLLGGHHGANGLARTLAGILACHPAITTAGDLALGVALDEPPPGWHVANPQAAKPVAAALLAGQPVRLEVEVADAKWLTHLSFSDAAEPAVRITDHAVQADDDELLLNPPVLVLGVGCERGCDAAELIDLARNTLEAEALAPGAIACVASVDVKMDEPAVHALARHLGVPVRFFTVHELNQQADRLQNPSDVVMQEIGCPGVAEGAALAAIGPDGVLAVPKLKSKRATLAIGRAQTSLDPQTIGHAQGQLFIVGIGPGPQDWRSPQVSAAVAAATDLVGYGLYLDLLGSAAQGKTRHESPLGQEIDRARMALDLAAQGKRVCLVCSGDAGIYALATLVFELIDHESRPDWRRCAIQVMPGISALQAAAARAGAPINHDFCTISLSDLLTPWDSIEKRLHAAAQADFVVCFYNPVSQRRRDQITRARDILLTGRPPETPVIIARQLGRDGEQVDVIPLGQLTADHADMLTLVMVGNSESRKVTFGGRDWVYTPRGYGKKLS